MFIAQGTTLAPNDTTEHPVPTRSSSFQHDLSSSGISTLGYNSSTTTVQDGSVPSIYCSRSKSNESTVVHPPYLSETSFRKALLAHAGLAGVLFLATTDATIVSTSLPTISAELRGSESQYAWVGVAYMLTQTACQPFFGKFSDLVGRKIVLAFSIFVFLLGSALCGAAETMIWLILARGVAGIGAGGLVNCVWVIAAELVPDDARPRWSQALSVTWSSSAVAGPLLGGLFSNQGSATLSWRWAFYINLPIGFTASAGLFWALKGVVLFRGQTNESEKDATWRHAVGNFDYLGLVLLVGGTISAVLGFSFASQYGWNSAVTLTLLVAGIAALAGGVANEILTRRDALLPAALFKTPTTVSILMISFLYSLAFTSGTFYLPLYFQAVHGSSPLVAGMRLLPYSLGSALVSMPVAWVLDWHKRRTGSAAAHRAVIILGLALSTLGFGLMIMLDERSSTALQEGLPLIAGLGIGMLFHPPFQVLTQALDPQALASATGAMFLVRFIGSTAGLSVCGAIFDSQVKRLLPQGIQLYDPGSPIDLRALVHIQPIELRSAVLGAVSYAISRIWVLCTPCVGIGLLVAFLIRCRESPENASPTTTLNSNSADLEKASISTSSKS